MDRPPEVDLHVEVLDAKLGISGVSPASLPRGVAAAFPGADRLVLVTAGGRRLMLTPGCEVVPLPDLYARLAETFPLRP